MEAKEYFDSGYGKLISEQYSEAMADFNKVLELDKSCERAYVHRAACKRNLGDFEGALADYRTAMFMNPNDPLTFLNAGYSLYKLDKNTTDTSYLNLAIKMDSENLPEAHYIRGMIYYNNKQYHLAIEDFSKAIDADSCHTGAYYIQRGMCYSFLDEYDKALADYNKVISMYCNTIELTRENADCYYYRGFTYLMQDKLANALSDLNIAIDLDPEFSCYYSARGMVYQRLHKYDKALADFNKAKELDPNNNNDDEIKDCQRKLTLKLVKS